MYCASGPTHPELLALAAELGEAIAQRGWTLVWGGGNVSAMGALASAARARGGWTVGVIPKMLVRREVADTEADELIVTDTMRERKQIMEDRADAFITLPGGIGTLEELVEQLTWQQLGQHSKPVLLANIDGFWEPLFDLLAHMRTTQFIRQGFAVEVLKAERVEEILPRLRAAAAHLPDSAKQMAPEVARRL